MTLSRSVRLEEREVIFMAFSQRTPNFALPLATQNDSIAFIPDWNSLATTVDTQMQLNKAASEVNSTEINSLETEINKLNSQAITPCDITLVTGASANYRARIYQTPTVGFWGGATIYGQNMGALPTEYGMRPILTINFTYPTATLTGGFAFIVDGNTITINSVLTKGEGNVTYIGLPTNVENTENVDIYVYLY